MGVYLPEEANLLDPFYKLIRNDFLVINVIIWETAKIDMTWKDSCYSRLKILVQNQYLAYRY